jgi:DcrB
VTDRKQASRQVDLVVAGTSTQGALTNVIVGIHPNRPWTPADLPDLVTAFREGLKHQLPDFLPRGEPEQLSLAGIPAIAHEYTYSHAGTLLHARQVVGLRGDTAYYVTLVAHPQAFTTDRAALDQILSSWSWG